jgi:hypothetical protein
MELENESHVEEGAAKLLHGGVHVPHVNLERYNELLDILANIESENTIEALQH